MRINGIIIHDICTIGIILQRYRRYRSIVFMRGVKKKKKEIVIGSPLSLYELLKKKGKKERKASYL